MAEKDSKHEGVEIPEDVDEAAASMRRAGDFFKEERLSVKSLGAGTTTPDNSVHGGVDSHSHHHAPQGWGRGIVQDFRSTIRTHWWAEVKNFNFKTIGVSLFLFIAVIAPSITFGAVYAKRTNNFMGAVELLLATAWCGIFYALVSGMPMVGDL